MTVRTRAQLNSDADSNLPDNTTGQISPAKIRARIKDLADSAKLAEDLAPVAASGSYSDLGNKPTLGTAAAKNVGTAAGNVPQLDGGGKLDVAVLPAVAITDTFVVSSQASMLALVAERGDVCIRTDVNKSYILATDSPGTLADWKELLMPPNAVLSVAGLVGAITAAALKTALALDNVDNTSDSTKNSAAATLSNKRITPRVQSVVSGATITPVGDSSDQYEVTALAAGATVAAPSGTPTDGQKLVIRVKDDGASRALSWNAIYRAGTDLPLPTASLSGRTIYLGFVFNSADTKWDLVGRTNI